MRISKERWFHLCLSHVSQSHWPVRDKGQHWENRVCLAQWSRLYYCSEFLLPLLVAGLHFPVLVMADLLLSLPVVWLRASVPLLSRRLRTITTFCPGVFPFSLEGGRVPGWRPLLQPAFWKADEMDTEWLGGREDMQQEYEINHCCYKRLRFSKVVM